MITRITHGVPELPAHSGSHVVTYLSSGAIALASAFQRIMLDTFDRLKAALDDRYAIERELGTGGMATVYLAEDLKLHRKVALKVLKPELAAALGPDRFLQEIDIAAKLTHPHILGLHDCGEADGFLYYVMPYIDGESLREKLAREGELPISDAVRILKEIVDALAKAHAAGVVHRDMKPDNVMLSDRHALVTDFGIAKAVSGATGRQNLTTEGIALGTPAYMAPEQAAADPHIDHRADIYAVGAVAYELLTGGPPFTGNTQQEILAAHVTQAAEPVTKHRESVPPALAGLVMKCLEKKPADRWQAAEELIPQLEALATPSGGMTPTGMVPTRGGRGAGRKIAVAIAAVVVIVAATVWITTYFPVGGPEPGNQRIAVAPLPNRTGDPGFDMHGRWAATTITQGLQRAGIGEPVPSSVIDQALANAGGITADPVVQLSELTGAGIVVTGELFQSGDSLELMAEIVDVGTGRVLYTPEPVRSTVSEARDANTRLARGVAAALASHFEVGGQWATDATIFSPPAKLEAFREFAAGVDMFFRSNRASLPYFSRARALDSSFVSPVLFAVATHENLSEYHLADSLLSELQSERYQLTPFERATVRFHEASVRGDLEGAYNAAVDRFELDSDGAFYALLEAFWTNRLEKALEFFSHMDMSLPGLAEWGSSWIMPAQALHQLGRHEEELELAAQLRQRFPEWYRSSEIEYRAFVALGRLDEMEEVLDRIASSRSPGNLGSWYYAAGLELRAHGFGDRATEMFDRAIQWFRALPDEERETRSGNLKHALAATGRWAEARAEFEALLEATPEDIDLLGGLGVTAAGEGNLERARLIGEQLAAIDRLYLHGRTKRWQARIAAMLGERDEAVRLLRSAFREGQRYGLWLHQDIYLESLRGYGPFEQLIRPRE